MGVSTAGDPFHVRRPVSVRRNGYQPIVNYAEIVVNVPTYRFRPAQGRDDAGAPADVREQLTQTYHYAIPREWSERLTPGHLVQVPFGKQEVQGIVVALHDESPMSNTRYITAVVDETPIVTPAQIDLAYWTSRYYLVPLFPVLQQMLPPGIEQRSRLVARWIGGTETPADLPAPAHELATTLRENGPLHSDQLKRRYPDEEWRKLLDILQARGLVSAATQLIQPRVRIKVEQMVRLTTAQPRMDLIASSLGRSSRKARLLGQLLQQWEALPASLNVFCEAVDCVEKDARDLEADGMVQISPPPAAIDLAVERDAAEAHLIAMRGLQKRQAILDYLAGEGEPVWVGAVYAETGANAATLRELAEAGLVALTEREIIRDPLVDLHYAPEQAPRLTPDQERVWLEVAGSFSDGAPAHHVFVLHGVTGSGKTEIYMRALERALELKRQAIILVPEIALTPQTIRRFSARFPGRVTTIHSKLSLGERYDQWRQIRNGEVDIVIGPRSAVFVPLRNLGVIVVDEEHEDAYKSDWMPAYHARYVALARGRLENCPVILGSATPSLETYFATQTGAYRLLELPRRIMGHARQIEAQRRQFHIPPGRQIDRPAAPGYDEARAIDLPRVEVVDLRAELRAGNRSMFSRTLQAELKRVMSRKEQAILFLNRRGTSTIVSCRDCGFVVKCPRCSVPMTYHGAQMALVCHQCNQRLPIPTECPECGSRRIRYLGAGTERVEAALHELLPTARTLRWDRDVTGSKGAHEAILDQFVAGEADILIGTQMIAKGLDLPLVTLVGVILADTGLFLPDFRAAERAFLLLTQVAGRAGRSILGGNVVIQTYNPEHYSIQFASRHDFAGFYQEEMRLRRELGYPPFCRLAALGYAHKKPDRARDQAQQMARRLRTYLDAQGATDASIIGPAPCFFSQVRGKHRWQIVLRASDPAELLAHFPLPAGWRLDIDPVSLL
jgi:primosomal protein N' (replication factor Y) (superfamily II helicase)